jgi:hypothetical protein
MFTMDALQGGPMEWQLHECRPVRNVSDWSRGPVPDTDTHSRATPSLPLHRRS